MKNVWMNLQKENSKFPMRGKEISEDLINFSNSNSYLNLKNLIYQKTVNHQNSFSHNISKSR